MKIITSEKITPIVNQAIALGLDVCSRLQGNAKKDTALPTKVALKDAEGNPILDGEGNQVYDTNGDLYYIGCEKNKSITIVNVHPFKLTSVTNTLNSYDTPEEDVVTDPVDDTNYQDIESSTITWIGGLPPFKIQLVTDLYNNIESEVLTPIIDTPLNANNVININPLLLTTNGDSSLNDRTYTLTKRVIDDTWYATDLDTESGNTNHQKYIGLLITDSFLIAPAKYRTLFIPFTPDQTDINNKEYGLSDIYKHYGPYSFGIPRIHELTPLSSSLNITYGTYITTSLYNLAVYVPGTSGIENTLLSGAYTYTYYNPDEANQTPVLNVLFNATNPVGVTPNQITTNILFNATDTLRYKTTRPKLATIVVNKDTPYITPSNTTITGSYLDVVWSIVSNTYSFLNSVNTSVSVNGNNGASLSFSGLGDASTAIPAGNHIAYANLTGGLNYNSQSIPIYINIDRALSILGIAFYKLVWTFYSGRINGYTGNIYNLQSSMTVSGGLPPATDGPYLGPHDYATFATNSKGSGWTNYRVDMSCSSDGDSNFYPGGLGYSFSGRL